MMGSTTKSVQSESKPQTGLSSAFREFDDNWSILTNKEKKSLLYEIGESQGILDDYWWDERRGSCHMHRPFIWDKNVAEVSFALSQITHLTDGHMDGQTDRQTDCSSLDCRCIAAAQ